MTLAPRLDRLQNEPPPAGWAGVFHVMRLLMSVTVVMVALFRLGRLVDLRRLGGVELQTRVPCSLSRSLELRTLLPTLLGSYKPARYEPAPAGQIVIVAALRSSAVSMGFGYIRRRCTSNAKHSSATSLGRDRERPVRCSIGRNRWRTVLGWQNSRSAAAFTVASFSCHARNVSNSTSLVNRTRA